MENTKNLKAFLPSNYYPLLYSCYQQSVLAIEETETAATNSAILSVICEELKRGATYRQKPMCFTAPSVSSFLLCLFSSLCRRRLDTEIESKIWWHIRRGQMIHVEMGHSLILTLSYYIPLLKDSLFLFGLPLSCDIDQDSSVSSSVRFQGVLGQISDHHCL